MTAEITEINSQCIGRQPSQFVRFLQWRMYYIVSLSLEGRGLWLSHPMGFEKETRCMQFRSPPPSAITPPYLHPQSGADQLDDGAELVAMEIHGNQ